jgi:hypothetical protein
LGLRLVAMTMTRRHSHLPRMYDMAIFHWKFGISLYTLLYYCFSHQDLLFVSTTCKGGFYCRVQHGAKGCVLFSCYVVGGHGVSEFLSFVIFTIPLYTLSLRRHVWNVTKVSSFVLSRTAVLYVIYHGSWWFIHQIMGTVLT